MTSHPSQTKRLDIGKRSPGKILASLVIIGTLTTQAYTALLRMVCNSASIPVVCSVPVDPALYPFLDYPMYSAAKDEGVTVPNYQLVAIFQDGTEKKLTPEDFGLSPYWFNTRLLPAFQAQDTVKITTYLSDYTAAGNPPFVATRFENNLFTITKDGVVTGPPESLTIDMTGRGNPEQARPGQANLEDSPQKADGK